MGWLPQSSLSSGDERSFSTHLGNLTVSFDSGRLDYSRPGFLESDEENEVQKTILMEDVEGSVHLEFLPIYPDRPLVFALEEPLSIPEDNNGFFCVTLTLGVGIRIKQTDTLIEEILEHPRKNTYWGPPNNGILSYQVRSSVYTNPREISEETGEEVAIVPIYYRNRRDEGDQVNKCLIPLRELDLYETEAGDLIFEVVELSHQEEHYQEPTPIKRPPREMRQDLDLLMGGPEKADSLFDKVRNLPKMDTLTSVFMNR
ncbi:MAG: DUF432 domain-containing protein [bacterium]